MASLQAGVRGVDADPPQWRGGAAAIEHLGSRLPAVAAANGLSTASLRSHLLTDASLRIDTDDRLLYVDPARVAASSPATSWLDGTGNTTATFTEHSKPGSARTIYLDFGGRTISGTAWNTSVVGESCYTDAYDADGVAGFSSEELKSIYSIWQRVAEDYAPFDVDVTTEQPPGDRLTRAGSTDDIYGTTVVITSRSGVYTCNCGGVAYLGVFDDTSDFYKPALVFWDALGASEKNVAEAISHEAGHNMGLGHDGTASTGYYTGHGSGATGWAPIMGVGYYQALVQWSRGQYSGANNVQDDYTVMQGNGLPLRPDDHGGSVSPASTMSRSDVNGVSTFDAEGVIERPGDVDAFAFYAAAGTATVTLSPAARSANLDAVVELRNAAGQVLASANPLEAVNASLSIVLPASGNYYVSVKGSGKGDPLLTGYSDYGSLGQYALTVMAASSVGQPPTAALAANPTSGTVPLTVTFSAAGSSDPEGGNLTYAWTFGDGSLANGASISHVYSTAGSYTAELRVTDSSGLTSLRSVNIDVRAPVVLQSLAVSDIAMSLSVQRNGLGRAKAVVKVLDTSGNPVPGATVNGRWSGLVSGTVGAITGNAGSATFSSPQTRSRGTFTFTVTGVTLAGYSYEAGRNTETTDSITR